MNAKRSLSVGCRILVTVHLRSGRTVGSNWCHCERSEAISLIETVQNRDCFVAPLLAMTTCRL
jgi:hypothetical protein